MADIEERRKDLEKKLKDYTDTYNWLCNCLNEKNTPEKKRELTIRKDVYFDYLNSAKSELSLLEEDIIATGSGRLLDNDPEERIKKMLSYKQF